MSTTIDTDTKTDEVTTKKENAKAARRRHYEKVKKLKALEKRVMQCIWDEFSEKEDPEAKGMVHIDNAQKLVECLLLAVNRIKSYYNLFGNGSEESICYDWLYNKKLWTGKYVSKLDIFDGKFQRKIVPETVLIRDYLQFDNGENKNDPLYNGFWNMLTHTFDSLRPISEHDLAVKYIGLLIREESAKLEPLNTCKDITY